MSLPEPKNTQKSLLIVAENRIDNKQEFIGGLLCCAIYEAYILQLRNNYKLQGNKKINSESISELCERENISCREKNILKNINTLRNNIIHFNKAQKQKENATIATVIRDCETIKDELIQLLYPNWKKPDYELLADAEASLFPNWWFTITETRKQPIPKKLTAEHFANLKAAQKEYMLPLGTYLQKECLANLHHDLKFADLSRVNSTSGYIWMSAVPTGKRRARVKLPGLTVLFMPHEIAVYLELPGKSHDYKKEYYGDLLFDDQYLKYISSKKITNRNFEFFHTWWYATREPVCSVEKYVSDVNNKEGLWVDLQSKTKAVLDKLAEKQPILTQNFFLIGKGYPRNEILEDVHLSSKLHEEIALDLQALYPIYEMLQKKVTP